MKKTFTNSVFDNASERLKDQRVDDAVTFVVYWSLFWFLYAFMGLLLYQLVKAANRMP